MNLSSILNSPVKNLLIFFREKLLSNLNLCIDGKLNNRNSRCLNDLDVIDPRYRLENLRHKLQSTIHLTLLILQALEIS